MRPGSGKSRWRRGGFDFGTQVDPNKKGWAVLQPALLAYKAHVGVAGAAHRAWDVRP